MTKNLSQQLAAEIKDSINLCNYLLDQLFHRRPQEYYSVPSASLQGSLFTSFQGQRQLIRSCSPHKLP